MFLHINGEALQLVYIVLADRAETGINQTVKANDENAPVKLLEFKDSVRKLPNADQTPGSVPAPAR